MPLEDTAERRQTHGFETLGQGQAVPAPDFLLMLIRHPRPEGQTNHLMVNLDETDGLQLGHGLPVAVRDGTHRLLRRLFEQHVPAIPCRLRQDLILHARLKVNFDLLEPCARTEVCVDPSIEAGPAGDTSRPHLHVNQIPRLLAERPGPFEVFRRVKVAVGWTVVGLNARQIDANDGGILVLVGDIDRPKSRATAQVQDAWARRQRRIEQPVAGAGFRQDFVEEIKPLLFLLITGKRVDTAAVSMIVSPVLFIIRILLGQSLPGAIRQYTYERRGKERGFRVGLLVRGKRNVGRRNSGCRSRIGPGCDRAGEGVVAVRVGSIAAVAVGDVVGMGVIQVVITGRVGALSRLKRGNGGRQGVRIGIVIRIRRMGVHLRTRVATGGAKRRRGGDGVMNKRAKSTADRGRGEASSWRCKSGREVFWGGLGRAWAGGADGTTLASAF